MNTFSGNKDCTLCHGEGSYMYDDNHGKICENCCTHPEGFTQLDPDMFAVKEGELVCKTGCGARKMNNSKKNQLPEDVEKRFDEKFFDEVVVCQKCRHSLDWHWWNGAGNQAHSGFDSCRHDNCECDGDSSEYVESVPIDRAEQLKQFLAQEIQRAKEEGAREERSRLLEIVKNIPITGFDTDGTRVASKLLKEIDNGND